MFITDLILKSTFRVFDYWLGQKMNFTTESTITRRSYSATGPFATLLILVNIWIISGNIIVLMVLYRLRKQPGLRVANMFLSNLAVMDLSIGFLLMPFSVVTIIAGEWVFQNAGCQLNGFINMFAGTGSILTMAVIAIDRLVSMQRVKNT